MDEIDALAAKAASRARRKKLILRAVATAAVGALVVLNPELASLLGPLVGSL